MDAGHDRGKWRRSCVPCALIVLTVLSLTAVEAQYENPTGHNTSQPKTCAENEYMSQNGICCDRCPPGFKLKGECPGKGLRSECEKCGDGTYLDATNHFRNCLTCRKCRTDVEDVVSMCTHEKNTVCACKTGYYKKVINSITWSCKRCKLCGTTEITRRECGGEKNTECDCKDTFYSMGNGVCLPCTNCTEKCPDWCSTTPRTPNETYHPKPDPIQATGFAVILGVVLALVLLTVGVKHWRKKKRAPVSIESSSPDCHKYEIRQPPMTTTVINVNGVLTSHCTEKEKDQLLPDCVPREIRTHEFIYSVLEVVPVSRFKELVRRLSVSEQDIDRAERDNRAFADAQYQMLKVWSANAPGGGKNILPRPFLQDFVDRLKDMNLNGCAESIENKYFNEA